MEDVISKKEFDELMSIKGNIRGLGFKTEAEFVLKEEGKEGLKKLEETMTKLGYPYKDIKAMEFYPLGLLGAALLVIKRLFNYDDKKFQEMGIFESKSSLIIRLFMRYFVSIDKVAKEAPNIWRKYYSIGNLKVVEYSLEKKYIIIRIENFSLTPILCSVLMGYYLSLVKMIIKEEVAGKETKCVHRGDNCHEFLVEW
jgi:hypothetical protein